MNKVRFCIYIVVFAFFSLPFWGAQLTRVEKIASIPYIQDTIAAPDTPSLDSLTLTQPADSIQQDSTERKDALDAPVDYSANDSIIFDMSTNHGYLYGDSKVDYTTLSIKSEKIVISMDSSIVHATPGIDSLKNEFGYPVFKDKDTEYEMKAVSYNFKSKKGFIRNVITQQGEGYIVADLAKKNADDSFFMCDGKYTTCDNHEHPHFYMMLTKAKVRPKKNVVTGPAYLVLEGLPLPLAIPFGFFPFSEKYSSGIIMPSYGDDMDRGFNLRGGGYYFAISDYIDLALTGDIYTKGSWALYAQSSYRKRYRYSGSFTLSYMFTKNGDKEVPETYTEGKDFKINWSHSQDPKANMYRTLSAYVNYSTTTYSQFHQESNYVGPNSPYSDRSNNTKSSTINLSQRFPNSPFSINLNSTINQISADSTISLTLPNVTVTMSSIYPFKRKDAVGSEKWYEKIKMSYTGDFRNSITTKDDQLFKSNLIKDWKNGAQHRIPISATYNLLNYINITPSFNYNETWFTRKTEKLWDPEKKTHVQGDTTYGFYRTYNFNYSVGLQTKLYGFYEPLFKIGKLKTIRHVFTPSVTFGGNPDFTDPRYGAYKEYKYIDSNGQVQVERYSPYTGQVFSPPSQTQSASATFSFENNLEMKVATDNDSTKVISLIDNLGISFGYNAMAPSSNKWSDITANVRLKLSKNLKIILNTSWDPYSYGWDPVKELPIKGRLRMLEGRGFARLKRTSYSFSPSINQDTFKKLFGKGDKSDKNKKNESLMDDSLLDEEDMLDDFDNQDRQGFNNNPRQDDTGSTYDEDGYTRNQVMWSLSPTYTFSYGWDSRFNPDKLEYHSRITHNFNLTGSIQPTKNWNFTFNTSYDFDRKKFASLNCSLSRNLHCWNISASFIPIGDNTSYYVSIRVNSSMLQDLKYEQRSRPSSYDPSW